MSVRVRRDTTRALILERILGDFVAIPFRTASLVNVFIRCVHGEFVNAAAHAAHQLLPTIAYRRDLGFVVVVVAVPLLDVRRPLLRLVRQYLAELFQLVASCIKEAQTLVQLDLLPLNLVAANVQAVCFPVVGGAGAIVIVLNATIGVVSVHLNRQ